MNTLTKKLAFAVITIFVIITISFSLIHIMPGNQLISLVGQEEYYYLLDNNPDELEKIREKYGLDEGIFSQYINYLKNCIKLDFGTAYYNKQPVVDNVMKAIKYTLMLTFPTWVVGGIIGGIIGIIAGWKPSSRFDKLVTSICLVVNTIPVNCIGLIFLTVFSYKLKLFPINGMASPGLTGMAKFFSLLHHMALPLIIAILYRISGNFMLMKSLVFQIRNSEYILTARSKGLSENKILFKHLMKNAILPYNTSMFIQLGYIFSGSMMLEVIFGWKGMGQLMVDAVSKKDFPTAQFCFLVTATSVVIANLLGDLFNSYVDPRIRDGVGNDE